MSLDITKLLDEVEAEVKTLLKSAQEDAANLAKAEKKDEKSEDSKVAKAEESAKEESKKEESKKEESSKEEKSAMEKADEEGSGYESQAPEASDEAAAAPEAEAAPEAQAEGADEVEDVAAMLKDLDDDMLHELYQRIKMELMGRMQAQEGSAEAAPEAAAAPEAEAAPAEQMQMSKSEKEYTEKLAKAESDLKSKEEEIAKLKKSLEEHEKGIGEFADIVKTLVERPVVRAATDIQFVSKDGDLKKSEKDMSDEEIKKAVDTLSADRKKLASLSKSELDVIADFYSGKNVKDKLIKVLNK